MALIDVHTEVFNEVYLPHLDDMARVQIYYGGSASGKSVFLAQRVVFDLLDGGRNYLIARQVGRTLRGSVFSEINKTINEWGVSHLLDVNKSDMLITCKNGYQAIFVGLDDVEKLKSITPARGVITDIWVEEATEIDRGSMKQLLKRQRGGDPNTPKRLTLSFNPIVKSHWLFSEYFAPIGWTDAQTRYQDDRLSILKTTYLDNRFLTPDDVYDLENETDHYYRNVYTLGNWGVLGNVIFTNWRVEDLSDPGSDYYLPEAQRTNRRNGLDFGFSSDPAAGSFVHYDGTRKRIYILHELYERGLTNDVLAAEILALIGSDLITCDSAEPKSIAELANHGVSAIGAKKGKDSVIFGIQWLQQHEIIVDRRCVETISELQQYKWREDKDGNALRIPVDRNNHIIDAIRYALEDDMEEREVKVVASILGGY